MNLRGKKVLILGSGGLRIGQAGEFDYSGSQAIKALKEEGISTILINPNIATVQTDPEMADQVYLLPLNFETAVRIIEKERPAGVLLGFGGQTALNLGLELADKGVFKKYDIEVLGTSIESIRFTEDRDLFKQNLSKIDIKTAHSICCHSLNEVEKAAEEIGFPLMMRSGFSLGGLGSGLIDNTQQLLERCREALCSAPHILIEEYLKGWKEVEYEIVRDIDDNAVCICNMENFDPMGIHTGESIVIAPSQTLTNEEYHNLRTIALKAARHFEIIGECNIQYALNPENGDYRVIEMNPRLSRSSALASKATGYPLAFVAAKLSLGYNLSEIPNTVTKKTPAFFEPALDYLVVKIPRWDTHKLKAADRYIGSEMKSVGEVMAIGRSFPEALQKAVRMLNIGCNGLSNYAHPIPDCELEVKKATDRRLFALYRYFQHGKSVEEAHQLSQIDCWFLHHILEIVKMENSLKSTQLSPELLISAKKQGFSDHTIAELQNSDEESIRTKRLEWNIIPVVKQIDTLAGEFNAETNYLYLTYHGNSHDILPNQDSGILVLGSGPYSIGSSVEFDWCGVNTARTLRKLNYPTIIINSNPETVSTDYDESDRLYFEELSLERVRDIADFENLKGIIVSVGGQVANNLAPKLHHHNYPILGTPAECIDLAENRQRFSSLLNHLEIDQPRWIEATSLDNAKLFAKKVGFPLLIRPSYVLSGSAMNVVSDENALERYLQEASLISPDHPVVISEFITEAKELEIDGVANHGEIVIEAISEHIENAGVHSGDATIVLPPQRLYLETIRRTKKITQEIVRALKITGPFNIQFIAKKNAIQVIECNVRSSRSFPFVSKVTGYNFIEIATKVITGHYHHEHYETLELDYVGVKSAQFSYNRLKGADPVAHVEMASTGEVACLGHDLLQAFFASWLATGQKIEKKRLLISIGGNKKNKFSKVLSELEKQGWEIYATEGTHKHLTENGIASICLYKISERVEPNVATIISGSSVDLVISIPTDDEPLKYIDGYQLRRLAIDHHLPLMTNVHTALLICQALCELSSDNIAIDSHREYLQTKKQHTILKKTHI